MSYLATPDLSRFGAVLKAVSESDTAGREQIEYIDIDLLDGDPRNFYALPNIAELAENILLVGLQQPLRVRAAENGRFVVTTGHRRRQALLKLVEQGYDQFRQVPCIREPEGESSAMTELRLICGNKDNRVRNGAELAREAERMESILLQLKKEGYEFQGKTRKLVAELLQVSETKLANAKAIKNGLKERSLQVAWEQGNITEACALEIARMPGRDQERLETWLREEKLPCTLRTVREFSALSIKLEHDCERAGRPCPNARAMYDAFVRNDNWEGCCGCCAMCLKRDTCETCCQYVERKEPEPAEEPEGDLEDAVPDWQAQREKFGSRLRKAREETGLDRAAFAERIGAYKATYSAWENGSLPGSSQFPDLARALGVSTDYLYGLTDDPTPPGETQPQPEGQLTIAGWMPGGVNPSEPGEFAVLVDVGNTRYFKTFMRWDGSSWLMLPSKQQAEFPPNWWLRLPPEPEKGETT